MTGEGDGQALAAGMKPRGAVLLLMGLALAGCGGLDGRAGGDAGGAATQAQAAASTADVAAPDVFQVVERGLWDGRPSLGGVWVAHPDATDPERVRIVNQENGQEVVGALFRRERDLPGPALQLSSDAAEALGVLAGAPTEIEVTALRRREAPEETVAEEPPAPEEAPAEEAAPATGAPTGEELAAALDAAPASEAAPAAADPAAVEAVAGATASILSAPEAAPTPEAPAEAPPAEPEPAPPAVAVDPAAIEAVAQATAAILANAAAAPAPDAGEIATTTLDGATPADAPAAAPVQAAPSGAIVQLGLFDVEANATAAAQALAAQGLPAQVIPSGDAWRLILGPATTDAEQAALLQAAVAAGFADAYLVSQ